MNVLSPSRIFTCAQPVPTSPQILISLRGPGVQSTVGLQMKKRILGANSSILVAGDVVMHAL